MGRVEAVSSKHKQVEDVSCPSIRVVCGHCDAPWPCETAQLKAERDTLQAQLAAVVGKSQEFHQASMNNYPHGTVEAMQRWYKAQKELGIILATLHAAAWVQLNGLLDSKRANPFIDAVKLARTKEDITKVGLFDA